MLPDYHIHTCFADGAATPEQMVLAALEAGLPELGFSEHAYVSFDPSYCMSRTQTQTYRTEIARLKTAYADRIRILCGIEMDYDAEDDPAAYDYVIGSVHYLEAKGQRYSVDLSPEETLRCIEEGFDGDSDSYAEAYFDKVARLPDKTHADIIGHFDLITKFSRRGAVINTDSPRCRAAWQAALRKLAGRAVLEINTGAMSRGYTDVPYPSAEMLRDWTALGGSVLLSSDAHAPRNIGYAFPEAHALALRQGCRLLDRLNIR